MLAELVSSVMLLLEQHPVLEALAPGLPLRDLRERVLRATKALPMLVVLVSPAQPCPWQERPCHGLGLRALALALVLSSGENLTQGTDDGGRTTLAVSCKVQPDS